MGRPRKYANDAEKLAAYRERNARLEINVKPQLVASIDELAKRFDVTRAELVTSCLLYALTNHAWNTGLPYRVKK